jgi:hypothetical protein
MKKTLKEQLKVYEQDLKICVSNHNEAKKLLTDNIAKRAHAEAEAKKLLADKMAEVQKLLKDNTANRVLDEAAVGLKSNAVKTVLLAKFRFQSMHIKPHIDFLEKTIVSRDLEVSKLKEKIKELEEVIHL